jgi:trans-feruloyl-CoA hydratase/vanillin synthase
MAAKKYETIKVEKEDGITWVILNRPDKRNAMSPQLHMDMDDVLDELAIDDETDILIVTGAGPAFCRAGHRLYFRHRSVPKRALRLQPMLAEALDF